MSYNGSGTFNINSTGQPVVAGTVITASAFNALTTDLATGLTTAITKDGQTTTTARITFAQGITSSLVTDSSSVSTGSIITAGGAGIAKNLYVGVNANVAGTLGVTGVATFSAAPIYSSLTASSAVATDASKGLVSVTNTGTGNNVLATAPTIASLNLTTALTLTGASGTAGQALTSGGSGVAPTWTTISSSPTAITNGTSNVTVNSSGGTITAATNGTTAITVDTSQNVGIGTASPATKLQVSAATPVITVTSTGTNASSQDFTSNGAAQRTTIGTEQSGGAGLFVGSSAYASVFGSAGASSTQFASNNTVRATITSGGNFLWGVTTLAGVSGADAKGIDYTDGMRLFSSRSSTAAREHIIFYNPNGDVGSIDTSASATAYNTSSDYRLKENIAPMTGALAKVAQLKPCTYKWKVDGSDGEGFIAHELAEVKPDCVTGEKDEVETYLDDEGNEQTRIKPQGIDTSFLVATLTAAIQELKAINDTQAETINALTARITALENA